MHYEIRNHPDHNRTRYDQLADAVDDLQNTPGASLWCVAQWRDCRIEFQCEDPLSPTPERRAAACRVATRAHVAEAESQAAAALARIRVIAAERVMAEL